MDAEAILRTFASLALVLGMLAAALWAVRRFDLRLPGRAAASGRLQLVERLSLDPKRSLVLVRHDGREHLLMLGPEGMSAIDVATSPPAAERAQRPPSASSASPGKDARPSFASLLGQHISRGRSEVRTDGGAPCDAH